MTLDQLERNLVRTLGLAVTAGHDDPDRHGELGGNAAMLLRQLHEAGGLGELVKACPETRVSREGRGT